MKKLYQSFLFNLIIAVSALALGIAMLPPFGIGKYMLNILFATTIIVYFLVYLLDKLRRTKGSIFILTVVECTVYFMLVLDMILEQFSVYNAFTVCRALGIFLWVRGVVSVIGMYIKATTYKNKKSNLPSFLLRIFFISLGVYLFANPLINDLILNWALCVIFFISALAFGGLAILFAPIKKK